MEFTERNPKYFYNINEFKDLKALEDNYGVILEELHALRKNSGNGYWMDTFPHYLYPQSKNKWKVFSFRFFGIKLTQNCIQCPKTAAILNELPGLISADFPYLPAQTQIKPHKGFTKMVIRAHLGLIIPENCGLRVGTETKTWEEGKLLIFDDSFEHEAWNNSDEDRFVLMLDIVNHLLKYSADEICKYKIENMEDKYMLNLFSKEQWKNYYSQGEFPDFPQYKI